MLVSCMNLIELFSLSKLVTPGTYAVMDEGCLLRESNPQNKGMSHCAIKMLV